MAEATGGFIPPSQDGPALERGQIDPGHVVPPASELRKYGREARVALNLAPPAS